MAHPFGRAEGFPVESDEEEDLPYQDEYHFAAPGTPGDVGMPDHTPKKD